jgi:D-sedoheptulose 7-phosphate isomerase
MKIFRDIVVAHHQILETSFDRLEQNFPLAQDMCVTALRNNKKLFVCGNGGSAADAHHFAAEVVGRYQKPRKALPALSLSADTSVLTAIANDYGFEQCFSRQIQGLGQKGDVLIAISTSGNSSNILEAAYTAQQIGIKVIALSGEGGGRLGLIADVLLAVASTHTARIQEIHGICLHALAEAIEIEFGSEKRNSD